MGEISSIWIGRAKSGPLEVVALGGGDRGRGDRRGRPGRAVPGGGVVRLVLAVVLIAAILMAACRAPGDSSDEVKRERIEELYAGYAASFGRVPGMSAAELSARLDSVARPVLIDVRTPAEQAVSMISGAITREEFERRRTELAGRSVVSYCTIGHRSGLYAQELRADGWEAFNLEGSILSWTHIGGDLVNQDGATRELHVYGRQWDLAASGYETVW